jgi:peroxiredoxin
MGYIEGNRMSIMTRRNALALAAAAASAGVVRAAAKLPRPAPDLVITLNSGQLVKLSGFRGKIVLVELLLTTCPHCVKCANVMQKMLDDFGGKGVAAMGGAINDGARSDLTRFQVSSGAKFPIGVSDRVFAYDEMIKPEKPPVYFPQLFVIDRRGMIREHHHGSDDFFLDEETNLRATLAKLLKEPA